jgi:hypothetical protein
MSQKTKYRDRKFIPKEYDYEREMEREVIMGNYGPISVPFQRTITASDDAEREIRKKYKDRGRSGREQMLKELDEIKKAEGKDMDLVEEYGKDAYKAKSFGTRKFSQGGLVYGKKFSGIY